MLPPCCCHLPSVKQTIRDLLELFCLQSFFYKSHHKVTNIECNAPWLISQHFKTKADSFHPAPFQGTGKRKLGTRSLRLCIGDTRPAEPQTQPALTHHPLIDQTRVYLSKLFVYLTECIKKICLFLKSIFINPSSLYQ